MNCNTERTYLYKEISSSVNDELKEKLRSSPTPVYDVLYASRQLSGRGRLGRSFFSPEGGLYFSAAYPLRGNEKNIPFLTLAAGLAVKRAIGGLCGTNVLIKWPNDIYLNSKKLCGILTELVSSKSGLHAAVGVGVNIGINAKDIPPELFGKMTSFAAENLPCPDKTELMKRIVRELDGMVCGEDILNAVPAGITDELNAASYLRGGSVVYGDRRGVFGDILSDGSAEVFFGGKAERIFTGEILPG